LLKSGDSASVRFFFAFLAADECNGDFSPTTVSMESELEEKEESLFF
jgi:hypothetical protein